QPTVLVSISQPVNKHLTELATVNHMRDSHSTWYSLILNLCDCHLTIKKSIYDCSDRKFTCLCFIYNTFDTDNTIYISRDVFLDTRYTSDCSKNLLAKSHDTSLVTFRITTNIQYTLYSLRYISLDTSDTI